MNTRIDNDIEGSVYLWLDNLMLNSLAAHKAYTGVFKSVDSDISSLKTWAAPHKQFVYDSSISNAIVPSGAYFGGIFRPISAAGGYGIDFLRGQAVSTGEVASQVVSGSYSHKEVNIYVTNNPIEQVLFEQTTQDKPKHISNFTGFGPNDLSFPLIFIHSEIGENKTISLDELSETSIPVRLTVLANSNSMLKSIGGIIRDKTDSHFARFSPEETPFTPIGGLKSGIFNYNDRALAIQNANINNLVYIDKTRTSSFSNEINHLIGFQTFGAFIDLDLKILRFPQ